MRLGVKPGRQRFKMEEERGWDAFAWGWSPQGYRRNRAHNAKVVGSNPAPATNQLKGLRQML